MLQLVATGPLSDLPDKHPPPPPNPHMLASEATVMSGSEGVMSLLAVVTLLTHQCSSVLAEMVIDTGLS